MLKISQVGAADQTVTLKLEGRVVGPWVGELRSACERAESQARTVSLDLEDVVFVDPTGVTLLSNLSARGVALLECSPFVEAQLKTSAP